MNEFLYQHFLVCKIDILYPKNKNVIKNVFCLNPTTYFYIVIQNRKDNYYILEESKLTKLRLDYIQNDCYYLKKNNYEFEKIRILLNTKNEIFMQLNEVKLFFKDCSHDIYMTDMFHDIYKIVY